MSDPDKGGLLAGLGVGVAVLACCALPLLATAGALGAVGGIVSNPWLLAAAGAVLAIVLARTAARLRSRTTSTQDGSCSPPQGEGSRAEPPTQHSDDDPTDRRFPR